MRAYLKEKYELDRQSELVYASKEAYKRAKAEDQEQLSMKDERIRQAQERIRYLEEENRRLRGE
jgi:hypothetical protein